MAQIYEENIIPKKSIKTKKVNNATNLISQSEPPAPKEIMVKEKFEVMFLFCL